MDFENKTVIITGGASGLGFLSGKCFSKKAQILFLLTLTKTLLMKGQ